MSNSSVLSDITQLSELSAGSANTQQLPAVTIVRNGLINYNNDK